MPKHFVYIVVALTFGFFSGCTDEASTPTIPTYYVHPELGEYLDRFLEEAAMRNIEVDTTGINLELVDEQLTALDGSAACGLAHVYGRSFPNVRISRTCWDLFSPEHKETLMFHELGHALLDRPHFDQDLPVGSPVSMMNSTSSRVYNMFTNFKRDYYIDELFGIASEVPYWGEAKTQLDTLFYYGIAEGVQPWAVLKDFVPDGGATTNVITDEQGNSAYRVHIPEQAKGSSLKLSITFEKDQMPRAGASVDFAVDIKFVNFDGPIPRLSMRADKISSVQTVHSGSNNPASLSSVTSLEYSTISIMPIDYFVDVADYITAEVLISGESTGEIWIDNLTIVERF